jgi:DNA-binding NarL/FixJ family response regulator
MPLTDRQLEVLQLLAEGKSTDQIADELVISKTTVRNHIAHMLANLGVHTRVQAIIAASRAGLIRIPPPEGN